MAATKLPTAAPQQVMLGRTYTVPAVLTMVGIAVALIVGAPLYGDKVPGRQSSKSDANEPADNVVWVPGGEFSMGMETSPMPLTFTGAAPVGSFPPNGYGLYDMLFRML